jgi:hypothetical protein
MAAATAINNIMANGNKDNMPLGNGIGGIGIGIDNINGDSNSKRNNAGPTINNNFHNNFNNTTKASNGNSNERIDNVGLCNSVDGPVSFMPIRSMSSETENQNRIFESNKQQQLGELMSATSQGVRNFGYAPNNNNANGNGNSNVNVNFNMNYNQQIAASNALLNNHQQGTHTNMNNFPFPGMRNPMFIPDVSFSNSHNNHNNGFYNNHHTDFSSSSAVQNPFALMEGNNHHASTQLIHGGGSGGHVNADRFDGEQPTLTPLLLGEGAYNVNGGPNNNNNNNNENHFKRKEDDSRGQEDFISSSKRMRSVLDNNQHQTNANPSSSSGDISGRAFLLYVEKDEGNLSHYQCLARKQMEVFEATSDDAGNNAQGRNRPILIGQIGIRCLHCSKLPPNERKTGSVYYPNRLEGIYQTAQKMTVGHLSKRCSMIPEEVRDRLLYLKDQKSSDGGGKRYWANSVRSLGVVETPRDGLSF